MFVPVVSADWQSSKKLRKGLYHRRRKEKEIWQSRCQSKGPSCGREPVVYAIKMHAIAVRVGYRELVAGG